MNRQSLEIALIAGGHRGWYLCGGQLDDTLTLGQTTGGWEVYYYERGRKTTLGTFAREDEACGYFLDYFRSDASTQALPG